MNKANIERLIPKAVEQLDRKFGDTIPSVYRGYIASFGVSIVQTGLLPTLAFFSKTGDNSDSDGERMLIAGLIADTLELNLDNNMLLFDYVKEYIRDNPNDIDNLTEQIKEASVAIKLAMNLFKIDKGGA